MKKYMPDFTKQDYALIIEALERRQYSYMTGDKMFREYESLVNEMRRRSLSAVPWSTV